MFKSIAWKKFSIGVVLSGLCTILLLDKATAQAYKTYPMWNPNLSFEVRINDLIGRLTLEEKAAQMLNAAPAIPRLGIPAYDWWNEVLHGVARTPFKVTSYPQAIAMAATWDTLSLKKMADFSANEGRAIHNKAIELGKTGERYWGLTYWTPNINIFRDPRWGRGQETYGEDPFLTAQLGKAFVRGLQGEDPKYLKAAACAKHFAVHSGPEPSRHSDNFDASPYDLWDTYLPAFRELITKTSVAGVMCAYNAVYRQPCCGSDLLMNDILRNQWQFKGYVTSDCWALDDFFKYHKTHPDATSAAVDAVLHGTDVECGQGVYLKLIEAVKKGLVKEEKLDESLRRLFMVRYQLGMFDPPHLVKFAQVGSEQLEAPEHQSHALKMARQSMVLLKNNNNTLPLSKNLKKIVVLGPNGNNKISVLGNYNGTPSKVVSVWEGIQEKLGPNTEVLFEQAINFTNDTMLVYNKVTEQFRIEGKSGVKAEYFNNNKLEGKPVKTVFLKEIDQYFTEGERPAAELPATYYSIRFTTTLRATTTETLLFEAEGDDGYRVLVNDSLQLDAWSRNRWGAKQMKLPVKAGSTYKIVVEYYQNEGNAGIKFKSGTYIKTDYAALLQKYRDADAFVFAGGISPQLEGEEMPVNYPGFNGGDRTSILLPAVQTNFMKALHQTGKPVVFVMMTGSAIATPWESEHLPAILNAWYGGQSAGTAIADILFGDYNPSGRLPVTFYKSDADLAGFSNYSMANRTYRYFPGEALYPFGFGLSYTQFKYENASARKTNNEETPIQVSVKVTNIGDRSGEEVVQLYLSFPEAKGTVPLRVLKGFTRTDLGKGESKQIEFTLNKEDLKLVDAEGKRYDYKGTLKVFVGGTQPQQPIESTSNVVELTIQY